MANSHLIRILLVFIAAFAVCSGQDVSVKISSEAEKVEQGDSFTFTCTVENLQGGSSFLQIQKYFHEDPAPITLTTNTIISQDFRDEERFAVAFEQGEGGALLFHFTVSEALAEDGGDYSCAIYGANGMIVDDRQMIIVENIENFSVTMKIKPASLDEVVLTSDETDEAEINLDDSEDFEVEVETSATQPAPTLSFFVGSHDITDQFTVESVAEISVGTNPKLSVLTFKATAKAEKLRVDHSYRSGFKVIAKAGEVEKELAVAVKFSGFPPSFEDDCGTEIKAIDHDKNKMFNCSFISSESPEVYIYYFRDLESGQEKEILYPGQDDSKYEFLLHELPDKMTYKSALNMEIVYPQMFREYHLVVKNTFGNITHKFEVVRDESAIIVPNGGPSHMSFSLATMLMFVLTTLVAKLS